MPYSTGFKNVVYVETLDTTGGLGVKCNIVSPAWRDELADLAARMIGPHPGMAVLVWDGLAFHWRVCQRSQRIHVDEMTREQ